MKTMISDPGTSVAIILSGRKGLVAILSHDDQLGRRMKAVRFERLSPTAWPKLGIARSTGLPSSALAFALE
ncbi:hypothetical protein LZ190_13690 [Rhodovulum sulfidophilum]|nr:hypothetical protein [Rhodovulum sulfidophilum]